MRTAIPQARSRIAAGDSSGNTSQASFTVTVQDEPVAVNATATTTRETPVTINDRFHIGFHHIPRAERDLVIELCRGPTRVAEKIPLY